MSNGIIATVAAVIIAILGVFAGIGIATATAAAPVPTGAVIFEDGSWRAPNGDTGCIPGQWCED